MLEPRTSQAPSRAGAVVPTQDWAFAPSEAAAHAVADGASLRRLYLDSFFARQVAAMEGCVLDVGGRKAHQRGRFDLSQAPGHVVRLNVDATAQPDVRADAQQLPVRGASIDHVVCAELLEHVPDARRLVQELARVLRPGGRLYLTAPFSYRIHGDPNDYARYTDAGLRQLLEDAGFTVRAVYRQGRLPAVAADMLKQAVEHGALGRTWVGQRLWWRLARWAQRRALRLERRPSAAAAFLQSFTTGFAVIAER